MQTTSGSATGFSDVQVAITLNGTVIPFGGNKAITALNNTGVTENINSWTLSAFATTNGVLTLQPGTYTIQVMAALAQGSNATIGGINPSALESIMQIIVMQ
jgi:hypothetical protein